MAFYSKRDYQQSKVYGVEIAWREEFIERQFESIDEVKHFAEAVCRSHKLPVPRFRVRKGPGFAHYEMTETGSEIAIGNNPLLMRPSVVLHELAHHKTMMRMKEDYAAHGPEFVGYYLQMVREYIGDSEANDLEWQMTGAGVDLRSDPGRVILNL